jgi:HNH endonuclease
MSRPPLSSAAVVERFWDRSIPEPNTGCWLYAGNTNAAGYGITTIRQRRLFAHRFAYELAVGKIPSGMLICHRCDTPACVNPDHLFIGSGADNTHDMQRKGRGRGRFTGATHCSHGHEFTAENTHVVPGESKRRCKACWTAANLRARNRKRGYSNV